jgi:hypothetical protein
MTQSSLVKIGVPASQAESVRLIRRVRQVMEQHDAAVARLGAELRARLKAITDEPVSDAPLLDATDGQTAAVQ